MDFLREIYNQNKRILAALEEKKKQWVKVGVIKERTGWNKLQLQQARRNGSVEWKKDKAGIIWYDINSLIINNHATNSSNTPPSA